MGIFTKLKSKLNRQSAFVEQMKQNWNIRRQKSIGINMLQEKK